MFLDFCSCWNLKKKGDSPASSLFELRQLQKYQQKNGFSTDATKETYVYTQFCFEIPKFLTRPLYLGH
jgi:hypothetical protein